MSATSSDPSAMIYSPANYLKKDILTLFLLFSLFSCEEAIEDVIPELVAPIGLEASKGTFPDKIDLSWQSVQGAKSYHIFKFNPSNGEYEYFNEVEGTNYEDKSIGLPGEKIYYRVRAVYSPNLVSELSSPVFGFLKEVLVDRLDAPLDLKISKGEFGNGVKLSWTPVPLSKKYQIFKYNKVSDSYMLAGETSDSVYFDNEITGYAAYEKIYYKVRSYNSEVAFSDFTAVSYGYFNGLKYQFYFEFGSQGTQDGEFLFPEHLAADKDGNIYVSDPNTARVQKFSSDGKFVSVFHQTESPRGLIFLNDGGYILARSSDNMISRYNTDKSLVHEFGGFGVENGKFHYFRQIALDNENFIYVVDHNNHRIQKFDLQGNFIMTWGKKAKEGVGNGEFVSPWGIIYFKGYILVSSENVIQFFTKAGVYVKEFSMESTCYDLATDGDNLYIAAGSYIIKTDEKFEVLEKIGEGDFATNTGVALGKNGEIIGTSVFTRKIRVYQ